MRHHESYTCYDITVMDDMSLQDWVEIALENAYEKFSKQNLHRWPDGLSERTFRTPESVCEYLNHVLATAIQGALKDKGYAIWFRANPVAPGGSYELRLNVLPSSMHPVMKHFLGEFHSFGYMCGVFVNCQNGGPEPLYNHIESSTSPAYTTSVCDLFPLFHDAFLTEADDTLQVCHHADEYLKALPFDANSKFRDSLQGLFAFDFDVPNPEQAVCATLNDMFDPQWRADLWKAREAMIVEITSTLDQVI